MERTQFTFYESFYTAMSRIRKKSDRADAYDTIAAYALYGTEPDMEKLSDAVALVFELTRPNLDASRRKAAGGKRGSKSKDDDKMPVRCVKDMRNKKEEEIEKENENKIENECYNPLPLTAADGELRDELSRVMTHYLDKLNALPSPSCVEELTAFTSDLGADVVLHAFGRAQDEKKTSWSYIRGILQNYTRAGYRTLDAVLAAEAAFDEAKARRVAANSSPDPAARPGATAEDMERMRRALERMKGEAE